MNESSEFLCPECQNGNLSPLDYCKRIVRYEDGSNEWVYIPRHRCNNPKCNRIHRMLPDFLLPFKHYTEQTVSDALKETFQISDECILDFPSEVTIQRWHHWMIKNELRINGLLRSIAFRELDYTRELLYSSVSLLSYLKSSIPTGWLMTIIRYIYNSGNQLLPVY